MFQDPLCMQIHKEKIPATTTIKIPQSTSEFHTLETLKKYMRAVNLPESGEQR